MPGCLEDCQQQPISWRRCPDPLEWAVQIRPRKLVEKAGIVRSPHRAYGARCPRGVADCTRRSPAHSASSAPEGSSSLRNESRASIPTHVRTVAEGWRWNTAKLVLHRDHITFAGALSHGPTRLKSGGFLDGISHSILEIHFTRFLPLGFAARTRCPFVSNGTRGARCGLLRRRCDASRGCRGRWR